MGEANFEKPVGQASLRRMFALPLVVWWLSCAPTFADQPKATAPAKPLASKRPTAANSLTFMYGEWRGTTKGIGRDGTRYSLVQTERIGPMLGGDILVVEGRAYDETGAVLFNAFGVISYDQQEKAWFFNAYNDGQSGHFPFTVTETGYQWTMPAGPHAKIVNTATVVDGTLSEETKYVPDEGPEVVTNFMVVHRIGPSTWPAAGAVLPQ